MTLTPVFLDELRARTHLSSLIARTTKLQKAGREMRGCCPFHDEKTPSFYVNDDKGFYHCFGCAAHGDAIRWLTDQRGLPFIDAVKELAAAAGLEMPAMDARAAERAQAAKGLHEAMQAAADWFAQQLGGLDGAPARDLLARRGIDEATQRTFGFGYAPDSRGKLRTALKDYGDALLVEAGLLIQVEGKEPYDRFRGRLMIPIRDPRGRVIAFGGRIIGEGEPKYLNSPDTPLFDKGRTLYNLDRAAPAARKAARVVVVEGYMDVVALARAGIGEAVAPLGTALTEAQLERLWRMADVPLLCFDGDAAGQKAALRAAHRALPLLQPGRSLQFATLPEGLDPDDLIRTGGPNAIEEVLRSAEPLVEQIWKVELARETLSTPEQRAGLGMRLRALAKEIREQTVREDYLATFNRMIWDLFHPERPSSAFRRFGKGHETRQPVSPRLIAISQYGIDEVTYTPALLKGLIRFPDLISPLAEMLVRLPIKAMKLRQTREVMLSAALDNSTLESAQLEAILKQEGLATVLKQMQEVTLAFSFLSYQVEDSLAKRDLELVTEALATSPELKAEIDAAQSRSTDWTDVDFSEFADLMKMKQQVDQAFQNALNPDDALAG